MMREGGGYRGEGDKGVGWGKGRCFETLCYVTTYYLNCETLLKAAGS